MTEVIKVGILGIVGVFMAVQFKAYKPEFGLLIGAVISILIFGFSINQISALLDKLEVLRQYMGDGERYFGMLMKVIGITYICEFSAGICKDAGYGAVADQIEILGKISVLFAGMPVLFAVIELIQGLA